MKRIAATLGIFLLITALFITFHPGHSLVAVFDKILTEKELVRPLSEYWNLASNTGPVRERVVHLVKSVGFLESLKAMWLAAFEEEWIYRGPLFLLILLGISPPWFRTALVWSFLLLPTYYWTMDHHYPVFCQAMILLGGLINGACIMHASDTSRYKALGMLLAIFLHGLANTFYLILFYYF